MDLDQMEILDSLDILYQQNMKQIQKGWMVKNPVLVLSEDHLLELE